MDACSFCLANALVGNPAELSAGLEISLSGRAVAQRLDAKDFWLLIEVLLDEVRLLPT